MTHNPPLVKPPLTPFPLPSILLPPSSSLHLSHTLQPAPLRALPHPSPSTSGLFHICIRWPSVFLICFDPPLLPAHELFQASLATWLRTATVSKRVRGIADRRTYIVCVSTYTYTYTYDMYK